MAPKNKKAEEAAVTAETPVEEIVEEAPKVEEITKAVMDACGIEAPEPDSAAETAKKQLAYMRELVPVTPAPPRSGEDPNYPIGINGKMWILPKGKTSMVPRYVALAFNQAEAAKGTQLDSQAELLKRQSGNTVDLSQLTEDQIAQLKKLLGL